MKVSTENLKMLLTSLKSIEKRYLSIEFSGSKKELKLLEEFKGGSELTNSDLLRLEEFILDRLGNFHFSKNVDIQSTDYIIEWHIILERGLYKRMDMLEKRIRKKENNLVLQSITIANSYNRIWRLFNLNPEDKQLNLEHRHLDEFFIRSQENIEKMNP